jgi:hypothetical protein
VAVDNRSKMAPAVSSTCLAVHADPFDEPGDP